MQIMACSQVTLVGPSTSPALQVSHALFAVPSGKGNLCLNLTFRHFSLFCLLPLLSFHISFISAVSHARRPWKSCADHSESYLSPSTRCLPECWQGYEISCVQAVVIFWDDLLEQCAYTEAKISILLKLKQMYIVLSQIQ